MRYLTLLILLFTSLHTSAAIRSSLSGRVTDSAGTPLTGAIIELPDLHTGASADTNGHYSIPNLPSGRFLVSIRLIGFATETRIIVVNGKTTQDFQLTEAVLEQHEIIVTGTSGASEQHRSTTPIQTITARQMREHTSTNVIDAITRMPGVQQLSTGPAISKPIIRGLGYNRIITLNDGIRQEGQQWGDEHGIEIDDYNVNRVEVLKGPASLSYGSDAIAGVVNILSEPAAPIGQIKGNIVANYQSNNGLQALHGRIAGNEHGLHWSTYYTGKRAHDYKNVYDGYVFNTRFSNSDFGATIGINKHWGSSRIAFTSFNQKLGLPEGERDSTTGRFIKPVDNNGVEAYAVVNDEDNKSFGRTVPGQQINHHKLTWVNSIYGANGGRTVVTLGYQKNERREFDDVTNPDEAELYLELQTINYGLQYVFPQHGGWQLSAGANGMYQLNDNLGGEFLIPDYKLFDIGAYVLARKEWAAWTLSAGLRGDYRRLRAQGLNVDSNGERVPEDDWGPGYQMLFSSFRRNFSSPSGSVGIAYAASERINLKANFALGFRAPNIAELSANGVHEGTIRYEYGSKDLKAEHSYQTDLGGEYHSEHLTLSLAAFCNYISNFVYIRKLSNTGGTDSIPEQNNAEGYTAFTYAQTAAMLYGGEVYSDFHPHPLDWLHLENTFSYVQGRIVKGTDSTQYLPNIPAPRWLVALRAQAKSLGRHIGNAYFKVELDNYFAQQNIFSAYGTETASPAYSLLNASVGFDMLHRGRTLASLTIAGSNLGDIGYQNHLSRLRYAPVNNVTGRTGIFGMGRNISVMLSVPLSLR